MPTAGTRLRKEAPSTRHSAYCTDETQEKGKIINQTQCPLRGRDSGKRHRHQPDTVPTEGTRLRKEIPSSTRHGAHCRDETQEKGKIINQTRCPLRGRDSGKGHSHQPDTVPTAGTRLRKRAQSSTRHGAHCGDKTQERDTVINQTRCPLQGRDSRKGHSHQPDMVPTPVTNTR